MNNVSRLKSGLLLLIFALAGCDSNQSDSAGNVTSTASPAETISPPQIQPRIPTTTMDAGETADMGGMNNGMGDMEHSQHMQHMAGGGMGGMDHTQHMEHMKAMSLMDPEQHRKHMAEMGCMNHTGSADETTSKHCMDHALHMQHMRETGHMDHADSPEVTDIAAPRTTAGGLYTASITSELEPIVINQIHSWTLHLENVAGEPVENAVITVDGGMPAHNHGLPTAPEVTKAFGNGDYLVEGLMFQMPGHWQVSFTISADDQTDSVIFNFALD